MKQKDNGENREFPNPVSGLFLKWLGFILFSLYCLVIPSETVAHSSFPRVSVCVCAMSVAGPGGAVCPVGAHPLPSVPLTNGSPDAQAQCHVLEERDDLGTET